MIRKASQKFRDLIETIPIEQRLLLPCDRGHEHLARTLDETQAEVDRCNGEEQRMDLTVFTGTPHITGQYNPWRGNFTTQTRIDNDFDENWCMACQENGLNICDAIPPLTALRIMKALGIGCVNELQRITCDDLLGIPSIGKITVRHIMDWLQEHGYSLCIIEKPEHAEQWERELSHGDIMVCQAAIY